LQILAAHKRRWLVPTAVFTVLALLYATLRTPTWEATQALIVRDEAAGRVGSLNRPGQFGRAEEMKTAQETILELVKSETVVAAALREVGPPNAQADSKNWPSERDIESLQGSVKLSPPKGAEFGKTEVFYLKVQSNNQQRAVKLAEALCQQLQLRFEQLRKMKAQSVTGELLKTVSLAQADLDASTNKLTKMEQQVGSDLAELRVLTESASGDSDLRRTSIELENELRAQRAIVANNQELLALLKSAQQDPGRLLASPNRLLESQPALRRLKDGLVDAQLRTAALLGPMAEAHPSVQSAKAAEQAISEHLHNELNIATRGIEVDLRVANERVRTLEAQRQAVQQRFANLATVRAEYSNLVAATRHRAEILKTAQQDLSESRASQAAAHTASLINPLDHPATGSRPTGPGRTVIVLAGLLGGLLTGFGVVFLTVDGAAGALGITPTVTVEPVKQPTPELVASPITTVELPPTIQWPAEKPEPAKAPAEPRVLPMTPPAAPAQPPRVTAASLTGQFVGLSFKQALQKVSTGATAH
jgi:polysaccharide biosynthesis transport protein